MSLRNSRIVCQILQLYMPDVSVKLSVGNYSFYNTSWLFHKVGVVNQKHYILVISTLALVEVCKYSHTHRAHAC